MSLVIELSLEIYDFYLYRKSTKRSAKKFSKNTENSNYKNKIGLQVRAIVDRHLNRYKTVKKRENLI